MRFKDLRWYILACSILLISFIALSLCLFLPVRGKVVNTIEDLAIEQVNANINFTEEAMNNYYKQFISGNYQSIETNFNKTGFIDKMNGNYIVIGEGKDFLGKEGDSSLYVFFYNEDPSKELAGYIPLQNILDFNKQNVVIFSQTGAIKYNSINDVVAGTMNNLVGNDGYIDTITSEHAFSGSYKVSGESGVVASNKIGNYYMAVFIPLSQAIISIDWVVNQTIIFIVVGVILVVAMLVLIIMGCYRGSMLVRIDRRNTKTPNSIVIRTDKEGNIIYANPAFKKLEYEIDKINIDDFYDTSTNKPIKEVFKEKKTIQCYLEKDNKTHYFLFTPIEVSNTFYLVGSDNSIDYRRVQHLEEVNGRHVITGCYNRFALRNRFETNLSNLKIDVAFVEFLILEHYDIISLFGNQTFEELLNEIINMLKEKFEGMEIYHIRDEQIVILYPNIDVNDVYASVEEMIEIFKKPFVIKTNNIYVRFKSVICNIKQEEFDTITSIEIERRNNAAFHSIKDFIKKDIAIYDPVMDGIVLAEKQLEEDLKVALTNSEFVQYLQPQFSLTENRIVGFESLLRWNNPKYIDKSIQTVIELAEQRGYMLDLAKIIIHNTFDLAKKLEKYNVSISLNLSPIQINQAGFVSDLIKEFNEYGLKEGSVALEITETFLMRNFSLVNEKLKILKRAGFKIHLDDFCTGYSSMKYLKDLPVDSIKIDKDFIHHVNTNHVNKSIVSCITTLAKELDLEVIAEGVENASQRDAVKKIGCKIIQGYLIGKAQPFEQTVELLESKK